MGWFTRRLRCYPNRDQWANISQCIASGFENARNEWFSLCVQQMKGSVASVESRLHPPLEGDVALELKAYQLGGISGFLASQDYIPKKRATDFCDLFWAQVGGTDLPRIVTKLREFMNVVPDARDFHLARRVAEYLTQRDVALAESVFLTPVVHAFWLFNCISVAHAFDDPATEAKLDTLLDAWAKRLPAKFEELALAIKEASAAA
jgi:hypothetical protein